MPEAIKEVGLEGVIFCYQVGLTYTAIWTKPKDQIRAEIPNYLKMSFGINTPADFYGGPLILRDDQVRDVIINIIREKAAAQKATGKFAAMKLALAKSKVR